MNTSKRILILISGLLLLIILSSNASASQYYNSYYNTPNPGLNTAFCIISLIIFIVWLVVVNWIYKDAKKYGKNPILWAILVFLFGLIGLIIYFVVRGNKKEPGRICPNCGREIPFDARTCPYCSKNFEQP